MRLTALDVTRELAGAMVDIDLERDPQARQAKNNDDDRDHTAVATPRSN